MSGESSKRSNLIDVTYEELHSILSGSSEGNTLDQISEHLKPRIAQLSNAVAPFGKPSDASRKRVESGSVTLRDGVVIRVEPEDKECVFAISSRLGIDEVDALVLLRCFLYNEGAPESISRENASLADELVEAITPFYYIERLYVLRALIPLFRATENEDDHIHPIANKFLLSILPDGNAFAETLLDEYTKKAKANLPENIADEPRKAAAWTRQNAKEQLVLLEVLYWTMWSYASRSGPLVARIYETAYGTNLGSQQQNSTLLLDEEGTQLQRDCAALWILITLEVLELERAAEPGGIQLAAQTADPEIYWSSPESLKRIHELVVSHGDSHYACTFIAWAFVLSRLSKAASETKELPPSYLPFFGSLLPQQGKSYLKDTEQIHILMARTCLEPDVGLFKLMFTLLTTSPVFVTATAWRTNSVILDPNTVAYRSVFKGLVIAITELISVELIPDFEAFVEVWIALFGRSESRSVMSICRQFWQSDWSEGIARRAILDIARSRFPIQFRPLVRLLRAMTAAGFLDTDGLSTTDYAAEGNPLEEDRELCTRHVFYYLNKLTTYTQVIPVNACTGAHALYERLPERYGSSSVAAGVSYVNLRPLKLPGGSILPPKSTGRLLSGDGGDLVVVCWQHEHSGWKLLLELLTDYVNRRRLHSGTGGAYQDISFAQKGGHKPLALRLEDIGVEMDREGDENIVMDVLDLIRSVIQDNPPLAEQLLESLESGNAVVAHTMVEAQPPDLVQLTTMILEEALSRSSAQPRSTIRAPLIIAAISVLSALLALPRYSNRVWLYIRSTASLFGPEKAIGVASTVLAAERLTGHYTMTLALLHLVQRLFYEASASALWVLQHNPRLQQVKEEVLLRAARFVHAEIWVEHMGWKYTQLGDRFEIGRRVSTLYSDILKQSSSSLKDGPFAALSRAVSDAFMMKATTSTITPLVSSMTNAGSVIDALYASRRIGDARRLVTLMESHLEFTRLLLISKERVMPSSEPSLLEQALCAKVGGSINTFDGGPSRVDPVDALAGYIKERSMSNLVRVLSVRVLFALCSSLSASHGPPPTIIGHLSDPESMVASLVRITQHPYDDVHLRKAVWNFIILAVDKEPALARLFVTGHFRVPTPKVSAKGKERAQDDTITKATSAVTVACDMLQGWRALLAVNPQLLASLLRFLDVVWQHGHEHRPYLESIRQNTAFFEQLAAIVSEELGPPPDYRTQDYVDIEGARRSDLHEAVSIHSYRTAVKAHAAHILAEDIRLVAEAQFDGSPSKKPSSYTAIEAMFKSEEKYAELLAEAAASAYDPELHDELAERIKSDFPSLALESLRIHEAVVERDYGDAFAFDTSLLQLRLQVFVRGDAMEVIEAHRKLTSINLNLSLAHVQTALTESWQYLLMRVTPYLRGNATLRRNFLSLAASTSESIAAEKRSGDMMSTIHAARLSLLLSLLEVVWFSTSDKPEEIKHFVTLVQNTRGIILNGPQTPVKSLMGQCPVPFHRPLLQTVYFCARHSRSLARRPKTLNAEQRLSISAMLDAALVLVIDSLRIKFDAACADLDRDLDQDLELLVAVFEQCTRTDVNVSHTFWLTRCQETDVVRASMQLFSRVDLVGISDLSLLRARKQPLYAPHILTFHMALASIPSAAEKLASEGILAAYTENPLSQAIRIGMIDVTIPELPGERSPAHRAYCTMLAIIAGVIMSLGRHGHFFDADASGLVQLWGDQIHRALTWTIGDTLTLPLLEELEQVVNLFAAIAQNLSAGKASGAVQKVLRFFTNDALLLVQQLNYALTHPNHLASLFEPITADERSKVEAESKTSVSSSADAVDPMRRPFLTRLMHRLFCLSASLVSTLCSISGAEVVLLGEQEDWPTQEALIVPHTKVVLGEPTSMGTLLELGNCSLDVLRQLVNRPAGQTITPPSSSELALDVRESIRPVRRNLEAVLLYAVTQLAMWLAKPELDASANDMDEDMRAETPPGPADSHALKARRRSSMPLAERLRRGMTGEMAGDLLGLLNKAKPVMAKSTEVLGQGNVDLTPVLVRFVQERISS
ncbi:nucleoporin subcomplex protein binding to Pom34-domain-containing protein [Fomitopsis serialis]|uniref:nucleoporin subcomplex protein binding to Pom34-domain-containing protein n=1 Tax=Fomitopsis serialis TaxID=139415 RepID=UPI0020080A2E|nr:nucleoporin subcomplex protein binding to Pom34-domain-containing protein [Neoantrodia serialis]KAH9927349.1 nucleoporin subcomplex protein binding to Pom34-domain-containing protein [Neoantrodia serialis]